VVEEAAPAPVPAPMPPAPKEAPAPVAEKQAPAPTPVAKEVAPAPVPTPTPTPASASASATAPAPVAKPTPAKTKPRIAFAPPPVKAPAPAAAASVPLPPPPAPAVAHEFTEVAPTADTSGPASAAFAEDEGKASFNLSMNDNFAERLNLPQKVLSTKFMAILMSGIFFFGLLLGIFMFGGSSGSEPQNTQFTIGYIVTNPEVPVGRPRCGAAEQSQGCVLYIQNNKNREIEAKDFYPLVMQLTGMQRFQIETGNMRYAHKSIKPGWIAQFNIPPASK